MTTRLTPGRALEFAVGRARIWTEASREYEAAFRRLGVSRWTMDETRGKGGDLEWIVEQIVHGCGTAPYETLPTPLTVLDSFRPDSGSVKALSEPDWRRVERRIPDLQREVREIRARYQARLTELLKKATEGAA